MAGKGFLAGTISKGSSPKFLNYRLDHGLMATTTFIATPKKKLWLAAIKPPMYTVAVTPITVGTAVAFAETNIFVGKIFAIFLISAIFIIAWLNISNDVFDAETGIDKNKAHSVVNLTGNRNLVFWVGNLFLLLGKYIHFHGIHS